MGWQNGRAAEAEMLVTSFGLSEWPCRDLYGVERVTYPGSIDPEQSALADLRGTMSWGHIQGACGDHKGHTVGMISMDPAYYVAVQPRDYSPFDL